VNSEQVRALRRLREILQTMDVPAGRIGDTFWLRRNLGFNNKEHRDFEEAMLLLRIIDK
jgi:hypothetical protein